MKESISSMTIFSDVSEVQLTPKSQASTYTDDSESQNNILQTILCCITRSKR